MNRPQTILLPLFAAMIVACSGNKADLSRERLGNMSYSSGSFEGVTITLRNGRHEGAIGGDESIQLEVGMLPQMANGILGSLDAAAVLLFSNSGGSGTFIDLAIVAGVDGVPKNIATTNLGDRVKVNSIAIKADTVVVNMLAHGPDDPLCCPSMPAVRKFILDGSELKEVQPAHDADNQP